MRSVRERKRKRGLKKLKIPSSLSVHHSVAIQTTTVNLLLFLLFIISIQLKIKRLKFAFAFLTFHMVPFIERRYLSIYWVWDDSEYGKNWNTMRTSKNARVRLSVAFFLIWLGIKCNEKWNGKSFWILWEKCKVIIKCVIKSRIFHAERQMHGMNI